ncbi:hypothetical protein [Allobaculum mucilyticum]|uniref:hypothetical protein n=1 Tax=Allobaculum mucilyticum TaxID=2834459 RepID=UPI001E45C0AC|nr:hypothetical protein [Allobaculum mucilyticum]UNT96877.1 hypothetical protein KWG62_03725 [Allobaculum mucilyticum]
MSDAKMTWLEQKLAQNGFTLHDLSVQTGLSMDVLQKLNQQGKGDSEEWNIVLDALNQYPVLYAPDPQILSDLSERIEEEGGDASCTVYYGVNQSDLLFVLCRFDDGSLHGADVETDDLRMLPMSLNDALELFTAQNFAIENASLTDLKA